MPLPGRVELSSCFPLVRKRILAELISYCIAGHHTGLPDYGSMGDVATDGTLFDWHEKKALEDYSAYRTEINTNSLAMPQLQIRPSRFRFGDRGQAYLGFSVSFLTRMLFSALVDADWLDTERYMDGAEKPRGQHASIGKLTEKFNRHLVRFDHPETPINHKRTETLTACTRKRRINQGSSP